MDIDAIKSQVDAYVDEVWEDVVEDIRSLVRIESVEDLEHAAPGAPFGPAPRAALDEAMGIARRLGLEVTDVDGYLGFGDVPGASDDYIATIAHTDIVPLGKGWNYDPLDVTRDRGYLLGRGVLDDKGPFVLSLYAAHFFRRLADAGETLPRTLRCIIGNNEETGMADVDYYLERYPEPFFCFSPDADFPLICGEKGHVGGLFTGGKAGGKVVELDGGTVSNAIPGQATALVRASATELPACEHITVEEVREGLARITATGKGGHASMPEGTLNAIGLLARYLLDNGIYDEESRSFLELQRVLTEDDYGEATGIASEDGKFGKLTCIAGTVRTVDSHFQQTIDSRYPTSTTGDAITARFEELAAEFDTEYRCVSDSVPFYIDPDCAEIKALVDTYNEYTDRDAKPYVIGGGTYARHFKRACAFGPHDPAFPEEDWVGIEHGPDEGVSEDVLRRALKIYIVSIARLMEL